jgi:hypothetical protein
MEAIRSSELLVTMLKTTGRQNPKDHSRHIPRREILIFPCSKSFHMSVSLFDQHVVFIITRASQPWLHTISLSENPQDLSCLIPDVLVVFRLLASSRLLQRPKGMDVLVTSSQLGIRPIVTGQCLA